MQDDPFGQGFWANWTKRGGGVRSSSDISDLFCLTSSLDKLMQNQSKLSDHIGMMLVCYQLSPWSRRIKTEVWWCAVCWCMLLCCLVFVLLRDVLRLRHFRPMGAEQSCCQGAGPSHAPEVVQAQNVQPVQFSKTKCLAGAPWAPASENDDEQNLQTAQSLSERTPTVLIAESNGSSSRQVPAVPAGSSFGIEKIEKMNHLEVDQDILRGIALHRILREYELWKSPEAVRQGNRAEKVWALSREVAAIDTFISHSWRTKGRWKVLSLLMQSGWPHAFVGWFLGVAIALSLTATEVLDPPLEATINVAGTIQTVPFGPWTLIFGCVMMLVGFLASPFLPCQDRLCFLDVACIHQGDTELLERGIYGIGGFLSVSRELRVLYSRPYLSSLWCILFARRYAVYISIPYALCDLMCLYILYFIQDKQLAGLQVLCTCFSFPSVARCLWACGFLQSQSQWKGYFLAHLDRALCNVFELGFLELITCRHLPCWLYIIWLSKTQFPCLLAHYLFCPLCSTCPFSAKELPRQKGANIWSEQFWAWPRFVRHWIWSCFHSQCNRRLVWQPSCFQGVCSRATSWKTAQHDSIASHSLVLYSLATHESNFLSSRVFFGPPKLWSRWPHNVDIFPLLVAILYLLVLGWLQCNLLPEWQNSSVRWQLFLWLDEDLGDLRGHLAMAFSWWRCCCRSSSISEHHSRGLLHLCLNHHDALEFGAFENQLHQLPVRHKRVRATCCRATCTGLAA